MTGGSFGNDVVLQFVLSCAVVLHNKCGPCVYLLYGREKGFIWLLWVTACTRCRKEGWVPVLDLFSTWGECGRTVQHVLWLCAVPSCRMVEY